MVVMFAMCARGAGIRQLTTALPSSGGGVFVVGIAVDVDGKIAHDFLLRQQIAAGIGPGIGAAHRCAGGIEQRLDGFGIAGRGRLGVVLAGSQPKKGKKGSKKG